MLSLPCFFMGIMKQRLNLPYEMLKACKSDRRICELLAMSVCIKCHYSDSLVKNVSARKIQAILHCGFNKASELLRRAKERKDLFHYNPYTNGLVARNIKKNFVIKTTDKHDRPIWMMYAIKLEKGDYSLREVIVLMRKMLVVNAVKAVEIGDKLKCRKHNPTLFAKRSPLTNRKLQHIAGLNNIRAVSRLKRSMIKEGMISYVRPRVVYATDCVSDAALEHQNLKDTFFIVDKRTGIAYMLTDSKYEIKDRRAGEGCVNIIFNHKGRHTLNPSNKGLNNAVEAYYERMEH